MPGGDRTGPLGQGRLTGWGRGRCAGATVAPRGWRFGAGRGAGYGGGWGHRHGCYATGLTGWQRGWRWGGRGAYDSEQELAVMKQQAASLEQELSELKARMQQLEQDAASSAAAIEKERR
jgi:hypothetical protein